MRFKRFKLFLRPTLPDFTPGRAIPHPRASTRGHGGHRVGSYAGRRAAVGRQGRFGGRCAAERIGGPRRARGAVVTGRQGRRRATPPPSARGTIGSLASGVLCATAWFVFIDSL